MINVSMSADLSAEFAQVKADIAAKSTSLKSHVTNRNNETKSLVQTENDATQMILGGLGTGDDLNANTLSVNGHTTAKADELKTLINLVANGTNLLTVYNALNGAIDGAKGGKSNGELFAKIYNERIHTENAINAARDSIKNGWDIAGLASHVSNVINAKSAIKSIRRISFDSVSIVGSVGYHDFAIAPVNTAKTLINIPFIQSPNLPNLNVKLPSSTAVRLTNSWSGGTITASGMIEVIEYV